MVNIELIIYSDLIITMDVNRRVICKGAIAVEKGIIVAIDEASYIKKSYTAALEINAGTDIILPGFINGHTHSPMTLLRGCSDDASLADWLGAIFSLEKVVIDRDFSYWGTTLALVEMIRGGITTIVDMYWHVDGVAQACHDMGMRAILGSTLLHHDHELEKAEDFVKRWKNHDFITPAFAPHSIPEVPLSLLKKAHEAALRYHAPILLHVDETEHGVTKVYDTYKVRPVELLVREQLLSNKYILAHAVHTSEKEIMEIAKAGAGIIHCPTSNMKLASGIAPVVAMLNAGCHVGLGTDGAASNNSLNMFTEMKLAVLLQRVHLKRADCIGAPIAVECATIRGAHALHKDHEIGSLQVGKKADIISITCDNLHQLPHYDPVSTVVFASNSCDIRTVIINGIVKLRDGKLQIAPELLQELRARVTDIGHKVANKLKGNIPQVR